MRNLTKKQQETLDLILRGEKPLDAVEKIYDCSSKSSLYVIKNKLYSNEVFKNELRKGTNLVNTIVETEAKRLAEILNDIFPPKERAMKLKELAEGKDSRVVLQAIQEMSKLDGAYPDAKLSIFHSLESEQQDLYLTEADKNKLIEEELQKRLKEGSENAQINEETQDKDKTQGQTQGEHKQLR